ncbi:RNA polymerase [Basidiobolus meristosporus CBS 931.73]|uniref:DNA-directed RNA polymerases I, II, and III subunit RPABC3 n=1 Tax=Basidiobolus meristosporus CBS 931.73 TaxID=1314790 RepID=A0A1Y1X8J4_9FUNG|nr:RNA polymerase [Basidiobolus meristosporus CBS 931.73]|eukprot:ORX82085.1 RNA polymerase [Basidiobolus meristosporus CBS 931.73]
MDKRENILFSDIFDIKDVDRDGKKFDRVSRLNARSENYDMELTLDFNNELYPLEIGDKFSLVLASSLSLDGVRDLDASGKKESWRERTEKNLADDYEYVMYGKVYKYDESSGSKVSVYASYGGLLMALEGDFRHLQNISVSENIYLLMRK